MAMNHPLVIEARHQAELVTLDDRFCAQEAEDRAVAQAPDGSWFIVRCDGVRANKRFLSQRLTHPVFTQAINDAAKQVCLLFRNFAPEGAQPYVAGALVISDEVSFIVNRGPNYHQRRLLKAATTLCSALAAAMSLRMERAARAAGEPLPEHPQIINFDARPLILADRVGVVDYVRWRRLLATRNALAKVLRLGGHCTSAELYEVSPPLADDFVALARRVGQRSRWQEVATAFEACTLHLFGETGWLTEHPVPTEPVPAGQAFALEALLDAVPGGRVAR